MSPWPDLDGSSYVHATALVVAEWGVLIRGASGSGKSSLATILLREAHQRGMFARLVGDDRVALSVRGERVVARGHPGVAGLIEHRTLGLVTLPFERACVIACVVDLSSDPLPRFPAEGSGKAEVLGVRVPCLDGPAAAEAGDRVGLFEAILLRFRGAGCDGKTSGF